MSQADLVPARGAPASPFAAPYAPSLPPPAPASGIHRGGAADGAAIVDQQQPFSLGPFQGGMMGHYGQSSPPTPSCPPLSVSATRVGVSGPVGVGLPASHIPLRPPSLPALCLLPCWRPWLWRRTTAPIDAADDQRHRTPTGDERGSVALAFTWRRDSRLPPDCHRQSPRNRLHAADIGASKRCQRRQLQQVQQLMAGQLA
mmetsp:Transcript_35338/g.101608  ORF Transcript_35338/g.101608 Transcript_35338/m.101608 type:complete len:201 (+) Transcript_35338:134-736(+)